MKRTLSLAMIPACATLVLAFWAWDRVPDPMPTHWNADGAPDAFGSRTVGLLLVPALAFALPLLIVGLTRLDPRRDHVERSGGVVRTLVIGLGVFLFGLHALIVRAALSETMHLDGGALLVLMGVLFVTIGNAMPMVRSNWFVGIRTPWTLSSERVWHRTHRFAGWTMTLAGLATIVAGLMLPAPIAVYVSLALILTGSLSPVLYSWADSRAEAGA